MRPPKRCPRRGGCEARTQGHLAWRAACAWARPCLRYSADEFTAGGRSPARRLALADRNAGAQRRHRLGYLPAAGGDRCASRSAECVGRRAGRRGGAADRALLRRGLELLRPTGRGVSLRPNRFWRLRWLRSRLDELAGAHGLGWVTLSWFCSGGRLSVARNGRRVAARDGRRGADPGSDVPQLHRRQERRSDGSGAGGRQGRAAARVPRARARVRPGQPG